MLADQFKLGFRNDINGLRAIAVAIVVLFHFGVPFFDGGYIGVDVFFVISGFLMTTIVYRGLTEGTFNVWEFYFARFKRIFPALAVLLIAVSLVLTFFVDPITSATNNGYVQSAALFYSNIVFAFKNSYFAASSEANWLLHTWSLSVEWQFYMVFPLVAAGIYWMSSSVKTAFIAICIASALSFGLAISLSQLSTGLIQQNFFQFPSRSWEMLLGGLVALVAIKPSETTRRVLEAIGLALIVISVLWLNEMSLWPAWTTLMPVLGTAMILLAGRPTSIWSDLSVVRYLGQRSYSIYLWHWPIVVGLAYFGAPAEEHVWALIAGLALSLFLAELSYRFVEGKAATFFTGLGVPARWAMCALVLACPVLLGGAMSGIATSNNVPASFSASAKTASANYLEAKSDWDGFRGCPSTQFDGPIWQNVNSCYMTGTGDERIAVIGDSHAEQFLPRFVAQTDRYAKLDVLYAPGCPPFVGIDRQHASYSCDRSTEKILSAVENGTYDKVVIISATSNYFNLSKEHAATCFINGSACHPVNDATPEHVEAFIDGAAERLKQLPMDVIVLGPGPIAPQTALELYLETYDTQAPAALSPMTRADMDAVLADAQHLSQEIATRAAVRYVDPVDFLCREDCSFYGAIGHLYRDNDHFRASAVVLPIFDWLDAVIYSQDGA